LKFNIDGTYQRTLENGTEVSGTWKFTEKETKIELRVSQDVTTINVSYVDPYNFMWASSDGNVLGRMVRM